MVRDKERKEDKMFSGMVDGQMDLFGDGWVYRYILRELKEHPLVKLKGIIDEILMKSGYLVEKFYSDEGRPSYPIGVLLKMLLLEYMYNLSDVQVSRMCIHDFLFRWFVGLGVMDKVPDDTTLVKFRKRLGEEGFKEVFDMLVDAAKKEGIVKGKLRIFDGTHIFASIPRLGTIGLMKQGVRRVYNEVKKRGERFARRLKEKYSGLIKGRIKKREREQEVKKEVKAFIKDVKKMDLGKDENFNKTLKALEMVVSGNPFKIGSFTDMDARWGRKSDSFSFCGYKAHIGATDNGFITSVKVHSGNVNESEDIISMVKEEKERGLEIEEVYADGWYDSAKIRDALEGEGVRCYIPSRRDGSRIDGFRIDGEELVCPRGKRSIGRIRQERGWLYYFSKLDCERCSLRKRCVGERKDPRARVYLSDCKAKRREDEKEKYQKTRPAIERVFGWMKRWHGMGRARYRGRWRVGIQVILTCILINLKIMANAP